MTKQAERASTFAALHVPGHPVILFNVWDAGSAKIAAATGAKAIATGSWSVAAANGYDDGEEIPLDGSLANLRRIVDVVDLPVSLDFEGAYAISPSDVQQNVGSAIRAGAVGINFEDQIVGGDALYPLGEQEERIRAARRAADKAGVSLFINARTDQFLKEPRDKHGAFVDAAIERGRAYAEAGASGFFIPGLVDAASIRKICEASPIPVNVMMLKEAGSPKDLAKLGVARISYGPGPYRLAMRAFETAAKEAHTALD